MTMYSSTNFKTKKALKDAVKANSGDLSIFAAGLGTPPSDGRAFLSGPHYPAPHTWYAVVTMMNGIIIKVK